MYFPPSLMIDCKAVSQGGGSTTLKVSGSHPSQLPRVSCLLYLVRTLGDVPQVLRNDSFLAWWHPPGCTRTRINKLSSHFARIHLWWRKKRAPKSSTNGYKHTDEGKENVSKKIKPLASSLSIRLESTTRDSNVNKFGVERICSDIR